MKAAGLNAGFSGMWCRQLWTLVDSKKLEASGLCDAKAVEVMYSDRRNMVRLSGRLGCTAKGVVENAFSACGSIGLGFWLFGL